MRPELRNAMLTVHYDMELNETQHEPTARLMHASALPPLQNGKRDFVDLLSNSSLICSNESTNQRQRKKKRILIGRF